MFDSKKLTEVVVRVCAEYGKDVAREAVDLGLSYCGGDDKQRLECRAIDATLHALEVYQENVGPALDVLLQLEDLWAEFNAWLGNDNPPTGSPPFVLGWLREIQRGDLRRYLEGVKQDMKCPGYTTGGEF